MFFFLPRGTGRQGTCQAWNLRDRGGVRAAFCWSACSGGSFAGTLFFLLLSSLFLSLLCMIYLRFCIYIRILYIRGAPLLVQRPFARALSLRLLLLVQNLIFVFSYWSIASCFIVSIFFTHRRAYENWLTSSVMPSLLFLFFPHRRAHAGS